MCWERSMASQRSFARPSCSRRNKVSQHGWTADNMCLNSYCILICFLKVQHSRWTMQDETTSTSWRCTAIAPTGSLSSRRSCWSRSCSWSLTRSSFPSATATSVSLRLPGSSYSSSVSSSSANHCVKPVQQRGPLQPVVCLTLWATQSVRRSGHISSTVQYKRIFFQLSGFLTSGWTNSCPLESTPHGEDECRPVRQIAPATNNEWQFFRLQQTMCGFVSDCNKQSIIIYQLAKTNEWQMTINQIVTNNEWTINYNFSNCTNPWMPIY